MATKQKPRARTADAGRKANAGKNAGKKGRKGARPAAGPVLPSVANHPTAGEQVKRAKAWAGLGAFGLVALLSWRAGVPFQDLVLRALAGGIVAYLVAWAAAVAVWRHLVVTELSVLREQREQEAAERAAALAAAAAQDEEAPPA